MIKIKKKNKNLIIEHEVKVSNAIRIIKYYKKYSFCLIKYVIFDYSIVVQVSTMG